MTNEEIIQKQEELFKEWEKKPIHKDKVFIRDGIIDIERWQKTEKKIVFLLKEAHGFDECTDLAELIRKNVEKFQTNKMWRIVSEWLYILNETTKGYIPPYSQLESQQQKCRDYLLSTAFLNIKKSNGKPQSSNENLEEYRDSDKSLLLRQLELYTPDIIICGSTKWLLDGIFQKSDMQDTGIDKWICQYNHMKIIDFWHPSLRPAGETEYLYYYTLGYLYQRSLTE